MGEGFAVQGDDLMGTPIRLVCRAVTLDAASRSIHPCSIGCEQFLTEVREHFVKAIHACPFLSLCGLTLAGPDGPDRRRFARADPPAVSAALRAIVSRRSLRGLGPNHVTALQSDDRALEMMRTLRA